MLTVKNKPVAVISSILGILVSWIAVEAWWDIKAISEEEYQQGQEQQARVDAAQNIRQDEINAAQDMRDDTFEMFVLDQDLYYRRKDQDNIEDMLVADPDDEALARRLDRVINEISEMEGTRCGLMANNGMEPPKCKGASDD